MTKAEIVAKISEKLGIEKTEVQNVVEHFMEGIKDSLEKGDNVYLRGFGSFIVKTRAEKTGRNIFFNSRNNRNVNSFSFYRWYNSFS